MAYNPMGMGAGMASRPGMDQALGAFRQWRSAQPQMRLGGPAGAPAAVAAPKMGGVQDIALRDPYQNPWMGKPAAGPAQPAPAGPEETPRQRAERQAQQKAARGQGRATVGVARGATGTNINPNQPAPRTPVPAPGVAAPRQPYITNGPMFSSYGQGFGG